MFSCCLLLTSERYNYLVNLKHTNETLFYYVLSNNLLELTPIVYTPTVGLACQQFGEHYRVAEGMYFTKQDKGFMAEMLKNWTRYGPADD